MKTFDSEMLTNFKQRQPKVPFSQAPKQAKTWKKLFFQKFVDVLESNDLNKSELGEAHRYVEKTFGLLERLCTRGIWLFFLNFC